MRLKEKIHTAVIVLVIALLLLPPVSYADNLKQKALLGLKGVEVVVEEMKPEAESLGLTAAQIQTDVELRLRKAGIRVLTEKESGENPGMPWLYVNVTTVFSSGLFAYSINVTLREMVTLDRGFRVNGTIWYTGGIGIAGKSKTREVRVDVGDYVDKFINDYLAANPKR